MYLCKFVKVYYLSNAWNAIIHHNNKKKKTGRAQDNGWNIYHKFIRILERKLIENRKIWVLTEYITARGAVADLLTVWRPVGKNSYKMLLIINNVSWFLANFVKIRMYDIGYSCSTFFPLYFAKRLARFYTIFILEILTVDSTTRRRWL